MLTGHKVLTELQAHRVQQVHKEHRVTKEKMEI